MAQIDMYRNNLLRKREELAKLNHELAKEQTKIAPLQKKIISARTDMGRTKSQSTMNSMLREIERASKSIADVEKKCGDIQKRIAQKEKEIAAVEKNYRNEELKINKRNAEQQKKQLREAERYKTAIQSTLLKQEKRQEKLQTEIEQLKAIPDKITVLFLAANPIDTPALRLDEEARMIFEKIRLSNYRDSIVFESRWATRTSDILQAINETNPTIIHFSGHGTNTGELVLLNSDGISKLVTKDAIASAMSTASDTIKLVVFNACFSQSQAESVIEYIDSAIGMSASIDDKAARVFAAQLYSSIGFGLSLQSAFDQAIAGVMLEGIPENNMPKLYVKDGLSSNQIVLVQPKGI